VVQAISTLCFVLDDLDHPVLHRGGAILALPQPRMASPTENTDAVSGESADDDRLDITAILEDCAFHQLSVEDPFLCNTETFNLHDAMAASQLMDRKMDCCEVSASAVAPWGDPDTMVFPRPIPSSLQDPLTPLPWEELTIPDAAYIALEIIVRLQSLLSGSSVGESIFTCLYAHSAVLADMETRLIPETLCSDETPLEKSFDRLKLNNNPALAAAQWSVFAVALGLVEITGAFRGVVRNADIYEEEDFSSNTHNITFYSSINSDALQILKTALKTLQNLPASEEIALLQNFLGFQMDFLSMCSGLCKLTANDVPKALITSQIKSREAVKKLQSLMAITDRLVDGDEYTTDVKNLLQRCFDNYVNRPLVGNLPIRKIRFQRAHDALPILSTITSEVDCYVCNLLLRGSSLARIQRMLDRFDQCNVLCRSLTVLNLYFDDKLLGQYPLRELVRAHIRQWQAPSSEDIWTESEHARAFLGRLAKPVYDCLKLRILNRNRQRAYIEAVLLPEWIPLQNEAQVVDVHCHQQLRQLENGGAGASSVSSPPTFFTRYVLSFLLHLMDRYVSSGIEVGLFHNSHHDLAFSFWYRDFLLNGINQNLSVMRQTKEAAAATKQRIEKPAKGKKKHQKKGANGKHEPPASSSEDLEDTLELKVVALKRNLCRKLMQFRAALLQAGILKEKRYEFTSLERIFEKRFEVFQDVRQPPPLSYAHYLEGNDFSLVPASDLLQTVAEGFQYCRASIEQLLEDMKKQKMDPMYAPISEQELRALLKVCIGNAVYVQRLGQLVNSGGEALSSATVIFDFDAHDQFCILKIQ